MSNEHKMIEVLAEAAPASERTRDGAAELAHKLGERTDSAIHYLGETLSEAALKVQEIKPSNPQLAQVSESVAASLETGGVYLSRQGYKDVAGDLTQLVKKYPSKAVLLSLGIGLLLGAATGRR